MSRTLLVIQSHASAREQVGWSWPHYLLPGWDVLGVCPENLPHTWPDGCKHARLLDRSDGYSTPSLIRRWVNTFACCLEDPAFAEYSDFCMIEYDGVFLRKPPPHPGGFFTHLAGGGVSGFLASRFYHTPWWPDRAAAKIVVEEGRKLIQEGKFERGSPDMFLGLISDRRPEISISETGTFSVNGNDLRNRMPAALEAVARPECFYAHGFRHRDELHKLLAAATGADSVRVSAT